MTLKKIIQHPYFYSFGIHAVLLIFFLFFYYAKDHSVEDIPIEITEFIRNLGVPEADHSHALKKKTAVASAPSAPSGGAPSESKATAASSSSSSSGGESVSEDYEVSEMPILLNEVRVPYPPEARTRKIQGNVIFDVLISSDGKVHELKVVSSPDPILTSAAQNAVSLFKFRPAKMGDKFVAIRIRYTYRFLLQ